MFHQFLPDATEFAFPVVQPGTPFDVELVLALDVSSYKTGAFFVRLHAGAFDANSNPNLTVTVEGQKIWPGEFRDPLFNIATSVLTSGIIGITTNNGDLVPASQAAIESPALRILVRFAATTNATNAGTITLSAGLLFRDS